MAAGLSFLQPAIVMVSLALKYLKAFCSPFTTKSKGSHRSSSPEWQWTPPHQTQGWPATLRPNISSSFRPSLLARQVPAVVSELHPAFEESRQLKSRLGRGMPTLHPATEKPVLANK